MNNLNLFEVLQRCEPIIKINKVGFIGRLDAHVMFQEDDEDTMNLFVGDIGFHRDDLETATFDKGVWTVFAYGEGEYNLELFEVAPLDYSMLEEFYT